MADNGVRTRQFWLPNCGDANTFVLVKVLMAVRESLRVMGNLTKRKKTSTTELNIFLSKKIFGQKIITLKKK